MAIGGDRPMAQRRAGGGEIPVHVAEDMTSITFMMTMISTHGGNHRVHEDDSQQLQQRYR